MRSTFKTPKLRKLRQKTDEDVIEQGGHFPGLASSRSWQLWPCGSGVNDRSKGLWNFHPPLRPGMYRNFSEGRPGEAIA